jgi:glycosyltransferase involved in cell wall biosynthesis
VPQADLAALYGAASAVAIVSLYEGFGMPALEALACGAPVVAGNRGSLPEIVGEAGLIVDPLDISSIAAGLAQAVTDTPIADQLRQAGPARARAFDWPTAARVTRASLEQAGQPDQHTPLPSPPRSAAN